MEEDNPTYKRSIFQFLLGREHWQELYKEFLRLKMEFFRAMGHQALVTRELCEEVWPSGGGGPPGCWVGPFLQVLSLCFSFRSKTRIHITGSGIGSASASSNLPGSEQWLLEAWVSAGGGWALQSGSPTAESCSHLGGAARSYCIPQCSEKA